MTIIHPLKIKDVVQETKDAISISFDVPEDLKEAYRFTQGQHLTLKEVLDGEEVRRSYSICSAVGEPELRIAVKKIAGGKYSNYANENFRPGKVIDVMEPQGRFFTPLSAENAKHYLAIAAGSGITPILSIIKTILKTEPASRVTLVYGNRSVSGIIFLEALEDLKNIYPDRFNIMHILSREHQDVELFNGRIDAEKCAALFESVIDVASLDEAFLCGPEEMIHAAEAALQARGMDKSHIHFELFITEAAKMAEIQTPQMEEAGPLRQVGIILNGRRSDVEVTEEGNSILEAGLDQGLDLPYACKGGVCSTCRAKVISGEVRMDTNYALEDDDVADGFVLTCQSHPLTDDVVVDYDA
ncbi:1,2-phenylacetyl-CoA epoxidase subunit PaaE [Sneathiella litorea]|uniref:Phenylacetate-CoA oxygenase/reductase subunit PaaK n=1 Tax=Sneathiella litorea TaxID=2606216 RepID=A0A6L8WBM1_9PROT|nr:1,2-phenylacetyl-CoA epoxidase subunit PaaE [Sneathiella litorea]MZR31823.1 phenylacetate-CoA oxygenase/reductase subunit PaaK [Sneathiella litorea]